MDSPRDDGPAEGLSELDELKALRPGLRTYARDVVQHIQKMEMPATPLEADRTCRMVTSADRMLVQVYATLDKLPSALPAAQSRDASAARPKPAPKRFVCPDDVEDELDDDFGEDDEDNDDSDDGKDKPQVRHLIEMIGRMTQNYAKTCGFWPDGAPFAEDDDLWPHRAEAIDLPEPPGDTIHEKVRNCVLRRANAMARFEAQAKGEWPDGQPYGEDSPVTKAGYWSSAARADAEDGPKARRLRDESPGPEAFPWWMVHKAAPDRHPPPA